MLELPEVRIHEKAQELEELLKASKCEDVTYLVFAVFMEHANGYTNAACQFSGTVPGDSSVLGDSRGNIFFTMFGESIGEERSFMEKVIIAFHIVKGLINA